MSDQMFSRMNQAALARLRARDPRALARKAGIGFDEEAQIYHIPTMGMDVTVSYPDYRFTPELPGCRMRSFRLPGGCFWIPARITI